MSTFGATSTADEVLEGIDLLGRTAFITGGYSGLGRETARAMARKGAHVIIAGRDEAKLAEAQKELAESTGGRIDTIVCDLASLEAVHGCGKTARDRFERIDLLINNAGVMACPKAVTADGFERQFGINHLGHFALTRELMPLIERGGTARIVNLSSRAHHISPVDFEDPHFEHRDYNEWVSYGQSKTANVLFTVGLERRFGDRGIRAFAVHPGGIQTNLGRHLSEEQAQALTERVTTADPNFAWKTIPQGAATTCWAATAPALSETGGVYCEDCHIAEVDDTSSTGGVRSYAIDPDKAERLWAMSERTIGSEFAA